jgi:release factor glutamine methyltransferase
MKLQDVLHKTTQFFKDKKFHSPRLDAELILAHGLGVERIQLYLKFDQPLSESELSICRELVRRRTSGEPVAYILGYRYFYGRRFNVSNKTLIPRPETEHLVEEALAWFKRNKIINPMIADLGCGTGCIGLSLLAEMPEAKLTALDISAEAIEVAMKNAVELGVDSRVNFIVQDAKLWLDEQEPEAYDAILANPPYISESDPDVEEMVRKFEPNQALFAADEGLELLKSWSKKSVKALKSPGLCLMEMGSKQAVEMIDSLETMTAFKVVRVIKDLSGHDRLILGEKNNG